MTDEEACAAVERLFPEVRRFPDGTWCATVVYPVLVVPRSDWDGLARREAGAHGARGMTEDVTEIERLKAEVHKLKALLRETQYNPEGDN